MPLRRKGLVVVAFPLLGLLVASSTFLLALREYRQAQRSVSRSLAVNSELRRILAFVLEDGTSARGYLLTGDERFLEPGAAARRSLPRALGQLVALVDGGQRERIADLPDLVATRLAVSDELIELASGDDRSGRMLTLLDDGQEITDRIRTHLGEMESGQLGILAQERSRAEKTGNVAVAAALVGLFGGLVGGTWSVNLFTRGVTRRVAGLESDAHRLEQGLSVVDPPPGRDEIGSLGQAMVRTSELLRAREAALVDAQLFLSRLLAAAPTGVFRVRVPDLTVAYASPNIDRLFGLSVDQALGSGLVAQVHSDDLQGVRSVVESIAVDPGAQKHVDLRLRVGDGSYRWVSAVALAHDPDERVSDDVLVYLTDVDDHLRAERALLEREATLRAVFEASPEVITIAGPDGVIRSVNSAVEGTLGYDPADVVGEFTYDRLHPDDVADVRAGFDVVRAGHPEPLKMRYRARHADGRWVHLDSQVAPLTGLGAGGALVVVTRDVTDQVRLEQAREQARAAAEDANRSKSEFLSRMSHELRTPLNAVLGFAQLLDLEDLSDEQRESVGHILKGGRHLLSLIDEVLDISRIETGQLNLSPEPVPVREILLEAVDLLRPLARAAGIQLISPDADVVGGYMLADRQRLKQILLNLLSNAVKYNRPGGTVTVSCPPATEGRRRIDVIDTGPGIAPEHLPMLFMPFERLGAEQSGIEGTGIGLALSQRLAEAMGGSLDVVSALGHGSTFRVELPAAEGPVERYERLNGGTVAEPPPPASRRGLVLHIEDNLANVKLVERILAQRGTVELMAAMQGRLGIELAQQHRPLLILLDLHLPDIGGDEVLRRLQEDPTTASIPVVVVSADATPGQVQRLLAAGAAAYLTKPINVRQLLSLFDDILGDDR